MTQSSLEVLQAAFAGAVGTVIEFFPNALSAVVILAVGWLVAKILQISVKKLLRAVKLDQAAERRAVLQPMRDAGIGTSASDLLGRLVYWAVLALFLVPAVEALRLPYVSMLLGRVVSFLPSLFTGGLILLVGLAAARVMAGSVEASAKAGGLEYASALGRLIRYVLNFLVMILALAQVGVHTGILTSVFTVLVVSLGLALALALGLGSRSVVNNLLAGAFARELFVEGATVEIQGKTGTIVAIRSVGTILETDGKRITMPNTMLIENIVE